MGVACIVALVAGAAGATILTIANFMIVVTIVLALGLAAGAFMVPLGTLFLAALKLGVAVQVGYGLGLGLLALRRR